MEDTKLIAKKRDLQGSSNARRLRRAGGLPGVIYGEGKAATAVEFEAHVFGQLLRHHSSETLITDIDLEGVGDVKVLVKDIQRHPVSGNMMHVDLLKIIAGQAIQVDILLELVGEAAGVKEGGVIDQVMHSISVECLPRNLVESIEVDISEMNIGDALHISDLDLGSKFTTSLAANTIVASVSAPRVEEEPEEGAAEGANAEPEVINEKKVDEAAD